MKILLDECVTKRLKQYLTEFEVHTLAEFGWSGTKNGELIKLCLENNFDVLLTIDKNLIHQQKIRQYSIIIAVLNSPSSKVEDLIKFLPAFKSQINTFVKPGAYVIVLP
jgi:predicted nuclease of predicted toxin-antitoxin system